MKSLSLSFPFSLSPLSLSNKKVQQKIIQGFSQAAPTYDQWAELQQRTGLKLLAVLSQLSQLGKINPGFNHLLDVGCGTGWLTEQAAKKFKPKSLWGLDISPKMIEYAKDTYPRSQVNYLVKSALAMEAGTQAFDVVFSNMCLQWVGELDKFFERCAAVLTSGGILACVLMLEGTYSEWEGIYRQATGKELPRWLPKPETIDKSRQTLSGDFELVHRELWGEKRFFLH